jgi:hypothetical protein
MEGRDPYTSATVNWLGSMMLAFFVAAGIGIMRKDWDLDEWHFARGHGWLSFLGLWLLCYWAVLAARRLWAARS